MAEDSQPNYIRFELGAGDGEFFSPPATHFIDTIMDLTDTLDYDSEDIDGMDDDAGVSPEPAVTERWMATCSHDVYMVGCTKGEQ